MAMLLKNYSCLLRQLKSSDWKISGVANFLSKPNNRSIILRHDVDRRPLKAIKMATLENKLGIESTYYFRASSEGQFPENAIKKIVDLGHEVGYHYETLSECNGDTSNAINKFSNNIRNFRLLASCKTVSMHGRPLSKYNNQDLLKGVTLNSYGLLGDAVSNMSLHAPIYFTDVGGRWNHKSANLRDIVPGSRNAMFTELNEFNVEKLLKTDLGPVYISTHPERWSEGVFDNIYCVSLDFIVNLIKMSLKLFASIVKNRIV